MIVGIDEVGRGPWAGPLVIGAVVLGCEIDGLTDSKKLSKKRRDELSAQILEQAAGVGLGWVQANELDEIGLSKSLVVATKRALEQIHTPYHEIIIDGTVNFLQDTPRGQFVTTLKKADLLIPSVSAASIVAKVARDKFMAEQDKLYPEYGFTTHVGYGTAAHRAAIDTYGVTPLHRLSFAPLARYRNYAVSHDQPEPLGDRVTTKRIGDSGEDVASEWLQKNGYEILERNWKTKYCEIDIVAKKAETVYFVEVKHRRNAAQGGGLAAITPMKLRKMKFAATLYSVNKRLHSDVQLVVITTIGDPIVFEQLLLIS